MKFVCPVCGYVFDEAQEKAAFSSLPETWQCPICKAAKSLFTPQGGEAPAISGEPAQAEELRPLTPGELAAVFSNLARGCEKQYHPEEEACFQELAAYFAGVAPQEPDRFRSSAACPFPGGLGPGLSRLSGSRPGGRGPWQPAGARVGRESDHHGPLPAGAVSAPGGGLPQEHPGVGVHGVRLCLRGGRSAGALPGVQGARLEV